MDPLVCIAFAGADGAGKTSLIRSLTATSGVKPFHSKVITLADVYPAPMLDPCCFIYDLVGGKTSDAHTNRYVRNLTAFNAVVIVLGNRITEIDRTIAEFCQKNNINCVFVRSKSDVDLMSLTEERGLDLDEAKTVLRNTVTDDFVRWASTLKTSNKMQKMVMLVNYKYWQDPKEYAKYEMHEKVFWEHLKRIAKYRETHF